MFHFPLLLLLSPTLRRPSANSASPNPAHKPSFPPPTFTPFLLLPIELQLQIWNHAVPCQLAVHGCIIVRTKRDQTILPLVRDMKHAFHHQRPLYRYPSNDPDYDFIWEIWKTGDSSTAESQRAVLHLMWTCRMSRHIARETYILDMDSLVKGEDCRWGQEGEAYFPPLSYHSKASSLVRRLPPLLSLERTRAIQFWLGASEKHDIRGRTCLRELRLIKIKMNVTLAIALDMNHITQMFIPSDGGIWTLPGLEKVELMLALMDRNEPLRFRKTGLGRIKFRGHEGFKSGQLRLCEDRTSTEIEQFVTKRLERLQCNGGTIPLIQCLVPDYL